MRSSSMPQNVNTIVDVYSFGLTLINMAVEEPLLDFIGHRWAFDHKKKKPPLNPLRIIGSMVQDEWRPGKAFLGRFFTLIFMLCLMPFGCWASLG